MAPTDTIPRKGKLSLARNPTLANAMMRFNSAFELVLESKSSTYTLAFHDPELELQYLEYFNREQRTINRNSCFIVAAANLFYMATAAVRFTSDKQYANLTLIRLLGAAVPTLANAFWLWFGSDKWVHRYAHITSAVSLISTLFIVSLDTCNFLGESQSSSVFCTRSQTENPLLFSFLMGYHALAQSTFVLTSALSWIHVILLFIVNPIFWKQSLEIGVQTIITKYCFLNITGMIGSYRKEVSSLILFFLKKLNKNDELKRNKRIHLYSFFFLFFSFLLFYFSPSLFFPP